MHRFASTQKDHTLSHKRMTTKKLTVYNQVQKEIVVN